MSDIVRKKAFEVLNLSESGGATLDGIIDRTLTGRTDFSRRDRALLNALVFGVLRWRKRIDWTLAHFSKRPIDAIDPQIRNILRLSLFQMMFLDRIPVHAAVHSAVELAKTVSPPWIVSFVNAVLRKAAKGHQRVPLPDPARSPARRLAVEKSFPGWLVDRWIRRYGSEETAGLCDSINGIPPLTVRTNTLLATREQVIESLSREAEHVAPTRVSSVGVVFRDPKVPISELAAFRAGWCGVQDEAAQIVSLLLDPRPGETVLDACAGRGGKTGHLAQLMENRGRITAIDIDPKKKAPLIAEMKRLEVEIVTTRTDDLMQPLPQALGTYDRILLDAPCSGLGVLRRNPDAKWARKGSDLSRHHDRQVELLSRVAGLLQPNGRLVYAVCSLEPEENESVIIDFLKNHGEFDILPPESDSPGALKPLLDESGFLRTFPHRHGMDGFFAACLLKRQ